MAELLAVVAHPDDESFGLGAALAVFVDSGRRVRVLCLTHGEASTVGADKDLRQIRAAEIACATDTLGVADTVLEDWPDGGLANIPRDVLTSRIEAQVRSADALLVFETGGVTGHPDHQVASRLTAQVAADHGLLLLEWGVPESVAAQLRLEFGLPLTGLLDDNRGNLLSLPVDRTRQWAAIRCHASQNPANPLLARRLELTGNKEWLRVRAAR